MKTKGKWKPSYLSGKVHAKDGGVIAFCFDTKNPHKTTDITIANAEYICKAVNNFEKMKKMIIRLQAEICLMCPVRSDNCYCTSHDKYEQLLKDIK